MNIFYWSGPAFLGFYFCFSICIFFVTRGLFRLIERNAYLLPPLDCALDCHFIAWLKNREQGVLELIVGLLIDQGFLKDMGNGKIIRTNKTIPDDRSVSKSDMKVIKHFTCAKKLCSASNLISSQIEKYRIQAEQGHMILTSKQLSIRKRIARSGLVIIIALGVIKLCIALLTGHYNVMFLLFFIFVVILILMYTGRFMDSSGIITSRYGNDYINRLKLPLKDAEKPELKYLLSILMGQAIVSSLANADSGGASSISIDSSDSSSGSSCGGSGCGGCGGSSGD